MCKSGLSPGILIFLAFRAKNGFLKHEFTQRMPGFIQGENWVSFFPRVFHLFYALSTWIEKNAYFCVSKACEHQCTYAVAVVCRSLLPELLVEQLTKRPALLRQIEKMAKTIVLHTLTY